MCSKFWSVCIRFWYKQVFRHDATRCRLSASTLIKSDAESAFRVAGKDSFDLLYLDFASLPHALCHINDALSRAFAQIRRVDAGCGMNVARALRERNEIFFVGHGDFAANVAKFAKPAVKFIAVAVHCLMQFQVCLQNARVGAACCATLQKAASAFRIHFVQAFRKAFEPLAEEFFVHGMLSHKNKAPQSCGALFVCRSLSTATEIRSCKRSCFYLLKRASKSSRHAVNSFGRCAPNFG